MNQPSAKRNSAPVGAYASSMRLLISVSLVASLGCASAPAAEEPAPQLVRVSGSETPTPRATPSTREYANPPADALGTLPQGYGVEVGQPAPRVTVQDMDGEAVELESLWRDQPVLLVFYRGGWCPYCNFQIHELTEAFEAFRERGVGLAVISVDRAEASARTSASWEIPFPVLSDPDLAAHQAFHVGNEVEPETLDRLRAMGMDLEHSSGREHHVIAVPAIFLIDREGVVTWAHADLDYRRRPSPEQVLGAIP